MTDLLILFLRCQNNESRKKSSECIPGWQEFLPVISYFHNIHKLRSSACLGFGAKRKHSKADLSLETAPKTPQREREVPVAQLGASQVALAVSHFPSGLKAALLSAVSELLPFVQFSIATLLSASAAFNSRRE